LLKWRWEGGGKEKEKTVSPGGKRKERNVRCYSMSKRKRKKRGKRAVQGAGGKRGDHNRAGSSVAVATGQVPGGHGGRGRGLCRKEREGLGWLL